MNIMPTRIGGACTAAFTGISEMMHRFSKAQTGLGCITELNQALDLGVSWDKGRHISCQINLSSTGNTQCRDSTSRWTAFVSSSNPFLFARQSSAIFHVNTLTPAIFPHASHSKASYSKGKGKRASTQAEEEPENSVKDAFDLKMFKIEKVMRIILDRHLEGLVKIRTGRAKPDLIEPLMVQVGPDDKRPLHSIAAVTQRNFQLLVVTVFNKQHTGAVIQCIETSEFHLQARLEGSEIHIPIPRPTVMLINRLCKQVDEMTEHVKLKLRNARQEGMEAVKVIAAGRKDDRFRMEKEVQRICDQFTAEADRLRAAKEKDLRENHL
ncbi:hypothetical protein CEUSTIGMA_g6937.t1 [Chlamydomonas eustigma]|uniref:Ribosome-recycling factor, chloroplastic n=1 Tax=Chlamydomonas eustigma TaxID=1157962 RepID=A0A250X8V4_9CHLO|nr:hypothetical protein CEUSTIGMA_g6937.t1 [Chlamydomonas eustigma]|eukprot:GAX79496.1 hypothetical protein CEUSTIGMA_g6937.t1 [Chlamydomonas eustigma]